MMNYEYFKEIVSERMSEFVPESMKDCVVRVQPVNKVNTVLDAIAIANPNEIGKPFPTLYMNDLYEMYKKSGDIDAVIKEAVDKIVEKTLNNDVELPQINKENVLDGVVFQLINTEQNKELLEGVPNRPFQDLSIVYRWIVKQGDSFTESAMVTNNLAEQFMVSEQELYEAAKVNTLQICQPKITSIDDVLRQILSEDGMPEEMVSVLVGDIPEDRMLWVISNERGFNGAHTMIYEDKLQELAEKLDSDLYILPSSIHEVIAVSASFGDPETLADMVAEINVNQVAIDDRLSNQVYHYDKEARVLSMATDTPNKRLDQMATKDMDMSAPDKKSR